MRVVHLHLSTHTPGPNFLSVLCLFCISHRRPVSPLGSLITREQGKAHSRWVSNEPVKVTKLPQDSTPLRLVSHSWSQMALTW
jgi:hypothetical protein